jgi:hypothetical protein
VRTLLDVRTLYWAMNFALVRCCRCTWSGKRTAGRWNLTRNSIFVLAPDAGIILVCPGSFCALIRPVSQSNHAGLDNKLSLASIGPIRSAGLDETATSAGGRSYGRTGLESNDI